MEYELRRGPLRAMAADQGGELTHFWDAEGVQYIWEGDPQFWSGRNPNLFPIVGNLKDSSVTIGGRSFSMKRHGFARNRAFRLIDRREDAVTLELTEDGDTLALYPFPFSFQVIHTLLDNGFSTTYRVENTGDGPMPFCVGGHTAIRCPLRPGERYEDYVLLFDQPEDVLSPTVAPNGCLSFHHTVKLLDGTDTLVPDHAHIASLDTFIFQGLRSSGVTLRDRKTGRGVRLDFPGFPMVAFWTVPGAPYLAMEPWHGCSALEDEDGRFEHKPHCVTLQPGEVKSLTYSFTLV